jgi:hypothetical protein
MKSFKILGWRKSLLAVIVGVLLVILPQFYRMMSYYFPESQRGIYQAVELATGKKLVIDSRRANDIRQIRVPDEKCELWIWYQYANRGRTIFKGKKDKTAWIGFKRDAEDKHYQYVWEYVVGQNKLARLVSYDRQTGKKLSVYQLVRENERN